MLRHIYIFVSNRQIYTVYLCIAHTHTYTHKNKCYKNSVTRVTSLPFLYPSSVRKLEENIIGQCQLKCFHLNTQ